jgi:phosphate transport system permease protein
MSALRSWLAEGTAQRWLTGGAIVLTLGMIVGLIAVVATIAAGFFWPQPLVELTLADSARVLGETRGREPDPRTPGGMRVRLKVGNRDVWSADFRWVREGEVTSRRTPADAWLLERREYGNFYGFARRLELDSGMIAAGDPRFSPALREGLARVDRLLAEERMLLKRVDHLHAPVARVAARLAATQIRGAAADVAQLRTALTAAQAEETRGAEPLLARLEVVRDQASRGTFVLATAAGLEHATKLAAIVRAVPVNTLSGTEKLGLYLARWWEFLSAAPREANTEGGIFPALFGTALMVLVMAIAVVPLGVMTAVYLNEYAREGAFTNSVRLALANLAGVPSIVFGAFGLAFFVYTLGGGIDRVFFSDTLPTPTFGTGGILWASLTLALLTLPVVVVATEEGLQSVPQAVRDGARALGATRWQTLRRVVLPYAAPGILTGAILAVARGAGEVAPLMLTGVVKLAPNLPFDSMPPFLHLERKFMHLGFHIYDVGFQSPNVEAAKPAVYAAAMVLLALVVVLNLTAILLRSRLRRRLRSAAV